MNIEGALLQSLGLSAESARIVTDEIERLRAELAEAKKDAPRLDWLLKGLSREALDRLMSP